MRGLGEAGRSSKPDLKGPCCSLKMLKMLASLVLGASRGLEVEASAGRAGVKFKPYVSLCPIPCVFSV